MKTHDELIDEFLSDNQFKPGGHAMLEAALPGLLKKAEDFNLHVLHEFSARIDSLETATAAKDAEIKRLRDTLGKFGKHAMGCDVWFLPMGKDEMICTCGLLVACCGTSD